MRLNYYSYYFHKFSDNSNFNFDLSKLLSLFCKISSNSYKNSFKDGKRNLYLFNPSTDLFLFLRTNDHNIIKKINSSTLATEDVTNLLQQDESIAFASYVYFYKNGFGIASPHASPKQAAFCNFVNDIINSIGLTDYELVLRPLIQEITKEQILDLNFIGKSTIEVGLLNTNFDKIIGVLGIPSTNIGDLSSIEITLKPKARTNIKDLVSPIVKNKDMMSDVDKFIISGKNDTSETLQQYYLEGQGILYNEIDFSNENQILTSIASAIRNNSELKSRLRIENESIGKTCPDDILQFHTSKSWDDILVGLQFGNQA